MTHFPNQPQPAPGNNAATAGKDTHPGESTLTSDAHDLLTPQRCENGVHADWAVDSEEDHACPWCEANRLRARVAAQEAALHDALVQVVATGKLRTERDLAQARIANLETAARSAAVLLRSAAALSDAGRSSHPGALRLAATCLDEATGTTPDPTEGGERP